MALSVSSFPETTALNQDSEPSSTSTTTTIRDIFSSNSGNPLTTKSPTPHISREDLKQAYDTAQLPRHTPGPLPSVPRPRQLSLTSASTRRTPPPPASGLRHQYQQLQQKFDLATNNPPSSRSVPGMVHHGLPQPPTVKVHHDWATNSCTAGVSFSAASSPRPLPTIPMPMVGLNSIASPSVSSGPIVESSKKAEARTATRVASSSTSASPSSSSAAGISMVSAESSAAASSSASAPILASISPLTSRTMPTRQTSIKIIPPAAGAFSSALAGPSSAIPTSPPSMPSPQLPPLNSNPNRPRAQTTAPITHPLSQPVSGASSGSTRLQNMTTAAELVGSPLLPLVPTASASPPSMSSPQPQQSVVAPGQGLSGPRPLPRIPPPGGAAISTPVAGPSTLPIVSSSGAAIATTYVSGSKNITTTTAGGSGSSAASSSGSSSSGAGPSTPRKSVMKVKQPRTSPGPDAAGNNLAALLGSNTASGIGLGPNLSRSDSITRTMTPSSSSRVHNISGPSGPSLSITTTTNAHPTSSILKRKTSASVSGVTPILSSSTYSSSAWSSPQKDTPPSSGPSSVTINPILKPSTSSSLPPVAGSSNIHTAPASAPIVPTSGMPPRSRSQSRSRTRVTLPPSPPSHTPTHGQVSSQSSRRTLQLHQPVPVASSWGAAVTTVGSSGSGNRVTSPPLPIAASTSASSSSSNVSVGATTPHSHLPPIPGSSMKRRGGSSAAAITSEGSSASTPSTTPPSTPGPSRSKPLPSGYGSKHSSTMSSSSGGASLSQTASMPTISGGRFTSQSHGHPHGPLPTRPGGAGAAMTAALLYAAVPSPISQNNANQVAGGSKPRSRSNSQTQLTGRPGTNGSGSLSRQTSLTGLGGVAIGGGSRPNSRSNSKSRSNSINTTTPTLSFISTGTSGRPSLKVAASPASSPRLGFAPQPAYISTSSPIGGVSHSTFTSPVSQDKPAAGSSFGATRATSPNGAVGNAGSRATSPLGAGARVRTTSPVGQRLFASSLGRKGKGLEYNSSGEDENVEGGETAKERGEWMYGPDNGISSVPRASNVVLATSPLPRARQSVDTRKEREERRLNMQKEERRMEERRRTEEKRREERARIKVDNKAGRTKYTDEDDDGMHKHPTFSRMSSDSEVAPTLKDKKKMSVISSRGTDGVEPRLQGDGEAFVNDEDYEPILSRSPSPMQYARPGSRSSLSSSVGSTFDRGHTNALSRGMDDDDYDTGYDRARNRHRAQRRTGSGSLDRARTVQLLSYRRSYRGPTGPDELSDAPLSRSSSVSSSGRGIVSPSPRVHSGSSSLRHLEGLAGQWKPGIGIGDAEMLEEQELGRSPSPIQYARRDSFDANIEMLDLENDLAEAQGVPERGRRATIRGRILSANSGREDVRDALEEYGGGGGFERELDVARSPGEMAEKSTWSDGETLHEKTKKSKKKTKTWGEAGKPSQLEFTLATVGAVLGMGDGEKNPKKEKKEKSKSKKEKRKKTDKDDQTATFCTSSSGSLRTSRGGSIIDITSLPPTPPQPSNGQATPVSKVSMKMQVLEPSGRRASKEDIGGSLKRLRTYTFDTYEPPTVLGATPFVNISLSRSKTDIKRHIRRSYSQRQIQVEVVDDPTNPWSSHWTSKLSLPGSDSSTDPSQAADQVNKLCPPPPEFQPLRKVDSPVSFETYQRTLPTAWSNRKKDPMNDSAETSSSDSTYSKKTSGQGGISVVNLASTLKFGLSVPVQRKAGRGGTKNSSESGVQGSD